MVYFSKMSEIFKSSDEKLKKYSSWANNYVWKYTYYLKTKTHLLIHLKILICVWCTCIICGIKHAKFSKGKMHPLSPSLLSQSSLWIHACILFSKQETGTVVRVDWKIGHIFHKIRVFIIIIQTYTKLWLTVISRYLVLKTICRQTRIGRMTGMAMRVLILNSSALFCPTHHCFFLNTNLYEDIL